MDSEAGELATRTAQPEGQGFTRIGGRGNVYWLSPCEDDGYAEYSDSDFLKLLGVELNGRSLSSFWPREGPQWDALGRSSRGNLFLVEAKSHIVIFKQKCVFGWYALAVGSRVLLLIKGFD